MSTDLGSIRVLQVDDEPGFLELASEFLERVDERLEVTIATGPEEALERIAGGSFDCVVSDFEMPGLNGIQLLTEVREDHPDLPFILFTGKGSEEIASEAISAGVTDYLRKGSDSSQYTVLANRIENCVSAHRAERVVNRLRDRYQRLIEKSTDAIAVVDDSGTFSYLSPAAESVLGYGPDELVGEIGFDYIHEADRETAKGRFGAMVDEDEPNATAPFRFKLPDGSWRWVEARGRNLLDDPVIEGVVVYVRDVSDRKQRARELEQQRARMEHALNATGSYLFEVEFESGEERRYGDFEAIHGIPESSVGTTSAFIERAVHPADRDEIRAWHERLDLEPGASVEFDYRTNPDVGEVRWVRAELRVERFSESDPLVGVGLATDITELKARELELEAQRDRAEALFEHSVDAIAFAEFVDGVPLLREINPAFQETFGCSREEAIGRPIDEIVVPDDEERQAAAEELNRQIEAGERVVAEVRRRTPEGLREFLIQSTPLSPGLSGRQTYTIYSDIAERKAYERALHGLHEASQRLLSADDQSAACRAVLEIADDVLEQPYGSVYLHEGDVLRAVAVSDRELAEHGEPPAFAPGEGLVGQVFEHGVQVTLEDTQADPRWIDKGGSWIRGISVAPLAEHGVLAFGSPGVGAFDDRDADLIRNLAAHTRVALDRIAREHELLEREGALQRQNERLDEFASVVSHDLRSPLHVAEGRLELAMEECESDDLEAVDAAHARMGELIDDLLELARSGAGIAELTPVSLAEEACDCWNGFESGSATLEVDTAATVRADASRLRQLLGNLLRNAVEHGGEDVTVTVGDLPNGFFVEDDGPGIDPDLADSVFEAGYSTARSGNGLGLNIARDIAEAHGWTLRLVEGEGARFEVTFGDDR